MLLGYYLGVLGWILTSGPGFTSHGYHQAFAVSFWGETKYQFLIGQQNISLSLRNWQAQLLAKLQRQNPAGSESESVDSVPAGSWVPNFRIRSLSGRFRVWALMAALPVDLGSEPHWRRRDLEIHVGLGFPYRRTLAA